MGAFFAADMSSEIDAHDLGTPTAPPESDAVIDAGARDHAPSRLDLVVLRTQSKEALVGLGWKPAIANAAVAAASTALGAEATLESLIVEALRRCPRPVG